MRLASILAATCLALSANAALATSPLMTTELISSIGSTFEGVSETSSADSDDKVVTLAREDAAAYVASDGRSIGARLEAALRLLRSKGLEMRSDHELAAWILAR